MKLINNKIVLSLTAATLFFTATSCKSPPAPIDEDRNAYTYARSVSAVEFNEIWGYIMIKNEDRFSKEFPISDIGYFVKAVDTYSRLQEVPPKEEHFADFTGRVHLVSSADSKAQTHLLLTQKEVRDQIIEDLIKASETYDGLQIDWELVPAKDKEAYLEFLMILKEKLGQKCLSVAVPARVKPLKSDAYDYEAINKIADRIIVMAYDEHWSTSAPGPVASNGWCKKIADYAKTIIPPEKLVMGLSFYGRAWSDDTEGKRAYTYDKLQKLRYNRKITDKKIQRSEEGIPYFTFEKPVMITVWFDDVKSNTERCRIYQENGIQNISFWRVGQESTGFWDNIGLK
ncbi:MAG: glycoside hydrolase [Treponema sp.]|nr:glycoside hydrolase [Treponema sp.]